MYLHRSLALCLTFWLSRIFHKLKCAIIDVHITLFSTQLKKKRGLKKSNHNVESYVNTGYQVFKEEYKIVVHITQLWCWKTFQSCTFRNLITSYILTCIIPWNQWFIWVCFHTWNSCFIFKILRLRKYYGDPGQQQPNDVLVHLQK